MKKFYIFLIFLCVSIAMQADDNIAQTIQSLSQYNQISSTDSDKLSMLKKLGGDTISFEFPNSFTHLNNFTKEIPDTIWIKKRPKRNSVEGKHYILSFVYKGEFAGNNYATPISEINGKKFGVLSVESKEIPSYYSIKNDYIFKLIDLDDLSIVECKIPANVLYDVTLSSNRVDRLISSLKNRKIYINTGSSYSPKYIRVTLVDGSYKLLFDYSSSVRYLKSIFDLEFVSDSGEHVPFSFDNSSYSSYSSPNAKRIISEEEYNSDFSTRTITSDIDSDVIHSDIETSFSFTYIVGTPKSSISYMSQTIDPTEVKSYPWSKNYKFAPEDAIFIAGTESVKEVRFYKMAYNGKAFYMKADDVRLSPEYQAKLDSLNNSSDEVKNYFFHHTLALSLAIYANRLNKAVDELKSYKKYGLAIKSWGVYDESEYTDGTGVNITFFNPTQQTIKYISFSFQGYNAVDDPCGRVISKRCIGPIAPEETASYQFEYVWFTDVVEYAKLRSITVTYKNGTTKTISNPNVIVFSDELRNELSRTNPVASFN